MGSIQDGRVRVFGVDVDNVSLAETVDHIACLARADRAHSVVTVNLDHILKLQQDKDFIRAYGAASLCVADGSPFVLVSRLDGTPLKERVAGSDLIEPVCQRAADDGLSVYFLGSSEERLDRAETELKRVFPNLTIAGRHSPPMGFATNPDAQREALDRIRAAKPDIVFVALGAPRQEIFSAQAVDEIGHGVFLNIGAGLDFISGDVQRAPGWMRSTGTEWIYRALSEPARLGPRYAKILIAFPRLLWHHYAQRGKPAQA